jgi:serine phosphatase RsbU (regulator of sigma subunit)
VKNEWRMNPISPPQSKREDSQMIAGSKAEKLAADEVSPPPRRIRALLIEDNPGDAHLIEIMLREADADSFELRHAERLEDGLKQLTDGGIDIVLSDLSLPDSHGLDTFARLHARSPHTPIIVLSGLNDTTIALNAVHDGAQDYLVKGQVDGQLLARAMRYAIERKRMSEQLHRYAGELREKNAQLQSDFNMAREIQQIFLPDQYPTFPHSVAPEDSALRFSHRYIPAEAVGGDFFDIFAITDTAAGVFICDVMGHGMRAALITAIMRGLIEELMPMAADAGRFLTEINRSLRAILRRTREPFLATAFYVVADAASGELRFANAGHPSPFRLRRDTNQIEPLKLHDPRHGPALGLFERSDYPTSRCPLAANDLIFLYTDGIYEVTNPDGDEFGQERLLQAVRRRIALPAEQMFKELLAEAQKFSGSEEFEDDVCLVGLEAGRIGNHV